jgi:hypothetical protein
MSFANPRLFGLNVKSSLAEVQDSNAALSALNIPRTDLDIIRGSADDGATIGDWVSLSRLSRPIYKTLDRYFQETSIYPTILNRSAGFNFPLLGNLQINGRLSGRSIRYRYVDGSGSGATIKFADISTSRASAWSSFVSSATDTSPIFYGDRVGIIAGGSLQFGTPTSSSQVRLQTAITPKNKEFDSEFPTHKINCTIGGKTVSLYAMKGIPVVFAGSFRNLSASVTLTSLINNVPASWKIVDADNSNIFVNYRNQGSNTSSITFSALRQKERFIEFYYNPDRISSIAIQSANISSLPQTKFQSLTSLDLSFNTIRNFPDLNTIAPTIRNIFLTNNPLYLNDNVNRRRLNAEVLSLIPQSLRQLHFSRTFFGSIDLNAIGDRLPLLTTLNLGRDNGPFFHPDTLNPSAPIPNVSNNTCEFYSIRGNDFRTIGISSETNANSKNVKELDNLIDLDLHGNFNLIDPTFSISSSNTKIQRIDIGGTGLPCPDLNGRQSLVSFNGDGCRNIEGIITPGGTYKFDGCSSLSGLSFGGSPLIGSFPIFTNPNLVNLNLGGTSLTGGTPEGDTTYVISKDTFSLCNKLQNLSIGSANLLASPIHPNAFDFTVSLVNISYNSSGSTTGPLPSFSACKNLRTINFANNKFDGTLPNFSANPNITTIQLNSNLFTGNVPSYRNLSLLYEINLFNNQLTEFPRKFTNLPSLQFFRAHNNQISGQIPDFSDCPILFSLILFNNQFSGYFSGSFSKLYGIRLIDLSNNLLTQQAINLIINDLFVNYDTLKRGGVTINLRGNALPGVTALERITFLNSKGWSIVF